MRRIIKNKILTAIFLILSLFYITSCDDIIFGGNIKESLSNDIQVTYQFYEYQDLAAAHQDVSYVIGRSAMAEDFPVYEHEDTLLAGWRYFYNPDTGRTVMPSNFLTDEKENITGFKVTPQPAALYAVWAKKCHITFVTNCDTELEALVLAEGETLEGKIQELRKEDYNFGGWYTDEEFSMPYDFYMTLTGDLTLYAKWNPILHITYHKNDGTQEGDNNGNYNWNTIQKWNYSEGENVWLPECLFGERSGYGFVGWAKTADATSPDYYTSDTIENLTESIELYAVWSTDIVKITYYDPTNTFDARTSVFGRGAKIRVGNVIRDENNWGYENLDFIWLISQKQINWWSTAANVAENTPYPQNENGSDGYHNQNIITVNSDLKLYAVWGRKYYRVTFYIGENGNGNDQYTYQEVEYGKTITKPLGTPYKPGYVFDAWYERIGYENRPILKDTPYTFDINLTDETVGKETKWLELYAKFVEGNSQRSEFFVYNERWWPYGNDSTGYGSLNKPWMTVSKAIEEIISQNNSTIDYTIYICGEIRDSLNITNLPAKSLTIKAMEDSWCEIKPLEYQNSYNSENDIPYVVNYELTIPLVFEDIKLYGKMSDSQSITLKGSAENILPEINQNQNEDNQGNSNINISFSESQQSDISVTRTQNGNSVTYTIANNYSNYIWKVNGVTDSSKTSNSATFNTSSWKSGKYEILLLVTDSDGNVYSYLNQITKN